MTSKKTRRNFILSSIAVASGIAGAKAIDQQDREIA
ncbi:MAG: aldo/keto reductase, partial [Microcoleus sp. Co-bin12]|nr:aldo/keto reductase [Microcoleus sp. Co-bin12]